MKLAYTTSLILGLSAAFLHAQAVPGLISYQGRIVDNVGVGLGTGTPVNRKILFRLFDAGTAGTRLWSEEQTVTISNGDFSVILGQGVGASYDGVTENNTHTLLTAFGGTNRYLEIIVDDGNGNFTTADTPITPRQRLISTAFAIRAATVDSIASGSDLSFGGPNYGLGLYDSSRLFGPNNINGPVLYGAGGGALGSVNGATKNLALRWDGSGNVGIGGSAPSSTFKLDVTGDSRTTGNQTITGTLTAGTLNVTGNSSVAGNQTTTGSLSAASISTSGNLSAGGIRFPNSAAVTDEATGGGVNGNYLSFGHFSFSEDYLGYRANTFYFKDSPDGGDNTQPGIDVGGGGVFGGAVSAPSITSSGGGSFQVLKTTSNLTLGTPANGVDGGGGMRLILYPGTSGTTPFGLGMNGSTLFSVVPDVAFHRWFGGTTERMSLNGSNGNLIVTGSVTGGSLATAGAITGGSLATTGAITGSSLAVSGNITASSKSVAVGEENLRIIRGTISNDGTILAGSGFTVDNNDNTLDPAGNPHGQYYVRFGTAFSAAPSVTATPYNPGSKDYAQVKDATASSVLLEVRFDGNFTDWPVTFIAIGPR